MGLVSLLLRKCVWFSVLLITEETSDYKEIEILCLKPLQIF